MVEWIRRSELATTSSTTILTYPMPSDQPTSSIPIFCSPFDTKTCTKTCPESVTVTCSPLSSSKNLVDHPPDTPHPLAIAYQFPSSFSCFLCFLVYLAPPPSIVFTHLIKVTVTLFDSAQKKNKQKTPVAIFPFPNL